MSYQFYCLTFQNEERRKRMDERFRACEIDCLFVEGISLEDEKIKNKIGVDHGAWSCMYGHLKMIETFYNNSDKKYAILCENDLYLHKNIKSLIPDIIYDFNHFDLDILLLSYLVSDRMEESGYFDPNNNPINGTSQIQFTYHKNLHEWLWGAQMYMINKSYAKYILDTYLYSDYAERTITDKSLKHFNTDFTITKDSPKKMVIHPMLAVEEGGRDGFHTINNPIDMDFHRRCHLKNFDPNVYI